MPCGLLCDPALHEGFEILRIGAESFLELVEPALDDSALTVGDLEIPARHTHALIQRQGARERCDRLVRQPLSEVENTEVVVSARIRRIDSAGERPQDVDLTAVRGCRWAGSCRCAHGVSLRAPRERWRRMRWRRGRAGRIRAGFPMAPRGRIPSQRRGSESRRAVRGRPRIRAPPKSVRW